jgi:hypothetical protein
MTARMRTIEKAAEYIKSVDPDTAITKNSIRQMIKAKKVPCVLVGKKQLLSIDILESYLASGETQAEPQDTSYGVIRQIPEKCTYKNLS